MDAEEQSRDENTENSGAAGSESPPYVIEMLDEDFLEDQDPLCDITNRVNYQEILCSERPEPPAKRKKQDINVSTSNESAIQAISELPAKRKQQDSEAGGSSPLVLQAVFFKRRFIGETSGSQFSTQIITGNCVGDVLRGIWNVVQPVLNREVVFVENNGIQIPAWADGQPEFDEMHKFVILQHQQQKKRVSIEKVDSRLLVSWRGHEIRAHVHVYSNSVSSKALWDLVDKQLVRFQNADRSGAPNNQALANLALELQEIHGDHFSGHSSAWKLWANYVHSASAHERERRKSEMPPNFLLKFFRSAPISEAVRMDTTRSGLSVASTINDGFTTELTDLEVDVDQMLAIGERVKHRIQALRSRSAINSSLVSAMQESVRPEENDLSRLLADRVTDMEDVDHMRM